MTINAPLPELTSSAPPRGAVKGLVHAVKAILGQRELLGLLVRREVKARYKDSSLGMVWSLLRPLTMLVIYYVAIGKFLGAERSIPEFAIFVFTGLTAWGLFSDIISSSTSSIITNAGLIKKVYLPREIFPLATVGSAGFNFIIQFGVLVAATLVLGQAPIHWDFFLVFLALAALLILAFSVGLMLSALNVYLRDIQHLVEVVLLVLFWASPIVYSYGFVNTAIGGGLLEEIYLANPLTVIVLAFQKGMWIAGSEQLWPAFLELRLVAISVGGLLLLWAAQRVFARLEGNFAQEL
ncbi:ABC transporter permease [Microcella daejeonensis]|uniref:ABC transporter permease n=1 Tax=Microcella daejeonensis TaxID=2994971 RepID=UPI00226E60F8|nr:ABC transporter permease [Microcella daejeonensis]WAB84027.1 ABC transporter permease [Microcella daejeonensis]